MVETADPARVDVYVTSHEFGRVLVGSLWLSDQHQAELAEMFGGVRA